MKRLVICLVGAMLCVSAQPLAAQNVWEWQYPFPQGNDLQDVDVFSTNTAIAVGDNGSVVKTTDAGTSWSTITVPDVPILNAVSILDALIVVAVGDEGVIVRSMDGGNSWSPQASGSSEHLLDVDFADALHGLAVGRNGTILRTNDGGLTWGTQVSGTSAVLSGVSLVDSNTATAVGSSGTVLRTVDAGTTWSPQTSGTTSYLRDVDFLDVNTGMAVGSFYVSNFETPLVIATTDGGTTWVLQPVPAFSMPQNVGPRSVWMTSASDVFVVGDYSDDQAWDGPQGILLQTHDGGTSWTWSTEANNLSGVAMFTGNQGLTVGAAGTIRKILAGNLEPLVGGGLQNISMMAVDFFDAQHGVAVAVENQATFPPDPSSQIYVTADGGTNWSIISGFFWTSFFDVTYADALTLYAVGHGPFNMDAGAAIYRSTDGGTMWQQWWSAGCPPVVPSCIREFYAVDFATSDTGVAVGIDNFGQGAILTVVNGVRTWESIPTSVPLNGVSVPSSQVAYAVGEGGVILKSLLGSGVWSLLASGTSARLMDVSFTEDMTGTVVGENGLILRTADGGTTWNPQTSGVANGLRDVSFIDTNDGIVLRYGNGVTTALLKTVDGGATWVNDAIPLGHTQQIGLLSAGVVYIDPRNVCAVGGDESILARREVPVVVVIQDFVAQSQVGEIVLRWSIQADESILGFQLYRSENGGPQSSVQRAYIAPDMGTYVDRDVRPGSSYEYVLAVIHMDGTETRSYLVTAGLPRPRAFLAQNEPNPFNPATRIRFSLPRQMPVELTVFDAAGRRVVTLVNEVHEAGEHVATWNGQDTDGVVVPSGTYFYQLATSERMMRRKMVLVR